MCTQSETGISGHATKHSNVLKQGQCSRCLLAIYPNMLCGIEMGDLVCGARVREAGLTPRSYNQSVLDEIRESFEYDRGVNAIAA